MTHRYRLVDGRLLDRDGRVVAKVESITFAHELEPQEVRGEGGDIGGGEADVGEQQRLGGTRSGSTTRKGGGSGEPSAGDIERVWACYVEVMEPRSKTLDLQTRKLIRNALKVASADECCGAIRGCKSSDFHMGVNDRRRKYNTISHILKGRVGKDTTRERVDFFLDLAAKAGVASDGTSVDPARLSNAKRDVRDAWEFPNDERVVRLGEESEAWLVAQGWRVEREEDGRPVFHRPES